MKNILYMITGFVCWTLCVPATSAQPTPGNPPGPGEQLQRIERRLNELADRQEQILRRLNLPPEQQAAAPTPGSEAPRPAPAPEPFQQTVVRIHRLGEVARWALCGFVACNVLVASWIFTDIRKRGEGPGIFVALALLAGIPAAIIYALVRIGDKVAIAAKPAA